MENQFIRQKLDELKSDYSEGDTFDRYVGNPPGSENGCEGFAKQIALEIFGSYPAGFLSRQYDWPSDQFEGDEDANGWRRYTRDYIAKYGLEPGDIILGQYDQFEHAAVVDRIEGDTLYIAELVRHNTVVDSPHYVHWGAFNYTSANYKLSTTLGYLVMVYKPPRKKIRFDPCGGRVEETSRKYKMFEQYGCFPIPERQGYTFVGWFPSRDSEREQCTTNQYVMDSQTQTFYARWSKQYYLRRGGRYLITDLKNDSVYTGKRLFTREGYRNTTWCISEGGGVQAVRYGTAPEYAIGMTCEEESNGAILRYHTQNESGSLVELKYPPLNCNTCRIYHKYLDMYLTGYDDGTVRWESRTSETENDQVWSIVEA